MKNLFEQYAIAYAKEKEMCKEREDLANKIKQMFKKKGIETADSKEGMFTTYTGFRFKYSEKVKKLQEKEVREGIAKKTEFEALKFTPKVKYEQI